MHLKFEFEYKTERNGEQGKVMIVNIHRRIKKKQRNIELVILQTMN